MKEQPMSKHLVLCFCALVLCGAGMARGQPEPASPPAQPSTRPPMQPTPPARPNQPAQPAAKEQGAPASDKALPRITILATGGTIAGKANTNSAVGYTSGQVSAQDLIDAVPGIEKVAKLSAEQIS